MKGKVVAIIFSITTFSGLLLAQAQNPPENEPVSHSVTHHALSATLEPYKEVQVKLKNMNKEQRKAYAAEIKSQWADLSPEEKQKLKQQIKIQLKQFKNNLPKEQNT